MADLSKIGAELAKDLGGKASEVVQKEVADVQGGENIKDSVKDAAKELGAAAMEKVQASFGGASAAEEKK